MIIGIPKESFPGEQRVALIPEDVATLNAKGMNVIVEAGAGQGAGCSDQAFVEKGAQIAASRSEVFAADVILQVRTLGANAEVGRADLPFLGAAQTLIGLTDPLTSLEAVKAVAATEATLFAMELMPRITRAQSMDSLSSMATISGYKAVLLAAYELPRIFPLFMTAAGTLAPARVLVIGAGVAGLQAIATARRLGAVVEAYDVRPAAEDQVRSLGAKFVDLGLEVEDTEGQGGYAKAQEDSFYRRQQEALGKVVAANDVVITTAAIPGKQAPVLVTAAMVEAMAPSSIIVDLAAERGGNCELTRPGEIAVEAGVKIFGPLNLPSTVPYHASQMYSHNISTFLLHLASANQLGSDVLDMEEDEIAQHTLVARNGRVVHPQVLEFLGASASI